MIFPRGQEINNKSSQADSVYANQYQSLLNRGAVGIVSRITHWSLERGLRSNSKFPVTLEIGAGHGQHFEHVRHQFDRYIETDIRIENLPRRQGVKVESMQLDAENLDKIKSSSVDRVVASCVLIHLDNPEIALQEWLRVLKPGGRLDFYLPCEPGILLRSLRYLTTVQKAKRLGVNHLSFHYREHRYSFPYLKMIIRENVNSGSTSALKWKTYPIPKVSWNYSLWKTVTILKSK